MTNIDERTNVPLYAVAVVVPFIVGAIFWLSHPLTQRLPRLRNGSGASKRDSLTSGERLIRIEGWNHHHQKKIKGEKMKHALFVVVPVSFTLFGCTKSGSVSPI